MCKTKETKVSITQWDLVELHGEKHMKEHEINNVDNGENNIMQEWQGT